MSTFLARTTFTWSPDQWTIRRVHATRWLALHGVLPREHTTDPVERSHGRWVAQQRLQLAGISDGWRVAELDENLPGWRFHLKDVAWLTHLTDCVAFREVHGRLPVEDTADRDEEALGRWLLKMTFFRKVGRLPDDRFQLLDDRLSGWQLLVAEDSWLTSATEVGYFVETEGRFPSKVGATTEERRLGAWLHNQRVRLTGRTAAQRARVTLLDEMVMGWKLPASR